MTSSREMLECYADALLTSHQLDHGGKWMTINAHNHITFFATERVARASILPDDEAVTLVRFIPPRDVDTLRRLYEINHDQMMALARNRWVAFSSEWFNNDDRRSFVTRGECEAWARECGKEHVLIRHVGHEWTQPEEYVAPTSARIDELESTGAVRRLADECRILTAAFDELRAKYYQLLHATTK
jgi:hypothetical protein